MLYKFSATNSTVGPFYIIIFFLTKKQKFPKGTRLQIDNQCNGCPLLSNCCYDICFEMVPENKMVPETKMVPENKNSRTFSLKLVFYYFCILLQKMSSFCSFSFCVCYTELTMFLPISDDFFFYFVLGWKRNFPNSFLSLWILKPDVFSICTFTQRPFKFIVFKSIDDPRQNSIRSILNTMMDWKFHRLTMKGWWC